MADDLGDEWWQDQASPEEEDDTEEKTTKRGSDAIEDLSAEPVSKKKKRKRRKITEYLEEKGEVAGTSSDVVQFFNKEFEGKLSAVELDEIQLNSDQHFFEANATSGFPVAYLKSICPKWKKQKVSHSGEGSPLLLILTSSAVRAVELNRQIQDFKGDNCQCAKLFAKHMKLEEQQKFLKKKVCHVGVGTPSRVLALLKSGHLKLEKLTALVIDWNWRDIKKKRLADIPEIRTELTSLMRSYVIPHVQTHSSCKIGLL